MGHAKGDIWLIFRICEMKKGLYFFSFLIGIVGIFGFLDPSGYWGYITLPITLSIGGLSALLIYLKYDNSDK